MSEFMKQYREQMAAQEQETAKREAEEEKKSRSFEIDMECATGGSPKEEY